MKLEYLEWNGMYIGQGFFMGSYIAVTGKSLSGVIDALFSEIAIVRSLKAWK